MSGREAMSDPAVLGAAALTRDRSRELLGQVTGPVVLAVGCSALGAYVGRDIGIFGAFTIFDFNRLRRSASDGAVPIAAGIFLDIFNVFLLALDLFGGGRE